MRSVLPILALSFLSTAVCAQDNPVARLAWQVGPVEAKIGDKATVRLPNGYGFLGADETKKFMELTHNFGSGREYLLAPESMLWFAIFEFDKVGYVKDDEKIDADALFESVKRGTEASNEERRKRGWGTMSLTGWRFRPQYDSTAKLLEWALIAKDDKSNEPVVNYNTRLLGRTGVMRVTLVTDPKSIDQAVTDFKSVIPAYSFVSGEKYSEFKAGDHVAEFGLAALVAGGAAAVATKKGFWALLAGFLAASWKLIVGAAVAVLAWLGSRFNSKK